MAPASDEQGPRAHESVDGDARVHEHVRGRQEAIASDRPVPRDVPEKPRETEPTGAEGERERDRHRMGARRHGSLNTTPSSTRVVTGPPDTERSIV